VIILILSVGGWGTEHTSTLDTVNNLANLYAARGKMVEAEMMCQRALSGYEKAWGPEHTSTLSTVNNLANLYRDQGKMAEAEKMYQRALAGYETALGRDHTATLETVKNLAEFYADQGMQDRAEDMFKRAFQGYEKIFGTHHERTSEILQAFLDLDLNRQVTSQRKPDLQEGKADLDTLENTSTLTQPGAGVDHPYQSLSSKVNQIVLQDLLMDDADSKISLGVEWDLPAFLHQGCLSGESIATLLILTTNGHHDQVTTCSQYLSWRWPQLGSLFIEFLDRPARTEEITINSK